MQYLSWRVSRTLPSWTAPVHQSTEQSRPSSTLDKSDKWAGRLVWGHTTYREGLRYLMRHDSSSQNLHNHNV
ncbi:hypothetical protein [Hymenobacter jejuensis]|uniref:Uncharacterized protein n=1 Tax=Hymenobacter jejuensis TaxID=2502781 RepID=A0A5B7ZZ19_9BACT|nr:hypothetical protein [Hymenobacter jejuensis]QDA59092.1 hypothetical protein FHG12_02760 [Hymenobacter jejuensis]